MALPRTPVHRGKERDRAGNGTSCELRSCEPKARSEVLCRALELQEGREALYPEFWGYSTGRGAAVL